MRLVITIVSSSEARAIPRLQTMPPSIWWCRTVQWRQTVQTEAGTLLRTNFPPFGGHIHSFPHCANRKRCSFSYFLLRLLFPLSPVNQNPAIVIHISPFLILFYPIISILHQHARPRNIPLAVEISIFHFFLRRTFSHTKRQNFKRKNFQPRESYSLEKFLHRREIFSQREENLGTFLDRSSEKKESSS